MDRPLSEPKVVDVVEPVIEKGLLGKTFKKDAKAVQEAIASLSNDDLISMDESLSTNG